MCNNCVKSKEQLDEETKQHILDNRPTTGTNVKEDVVNKPKHYALFGDIEAIHVIRKSMTDEQWHGYCLGNIMKYRLRAGNKDALEQDIAKANKYKELYEELL
tara:strand:- start:4214 stop:4522 length:309 start_codon:yes stop_codon:yes gene_type:complete